MIKALGYLFVGFSLILSAQSFAQTAQSIAQTAQREAERSRQELARNQAERDAAQLQARLRDSENARALAERKAAAAERSPEHAFAAGAQAPARSSPPRQIDIRNETDETREFIILCALLVPAAGAAVAMGLRWANRGPLGDKDRFHIATLMGSLFALLLAYSLSVGWAA